MKWNERRERHSPKSLDLDKILSPNIRYSAVDKPARLTIVLDCDTSAVTPWERLQEKPQINIFRVTNFPENSCQPTVYVQIKAWLSFSLKLHSTPLKNTVEVHLLFQIARFVEIRSICCSFRWMYLSFSQFCIYFCWDLRLRNAISRDIVRISTKRAKEAGQWLY